MPPSPDATPYVDLTVYDADAQGIFEAAIADLGAYLPEWTPREGNTEVLLLEAMALEVSETVYAINRVPGAIVEVLLRLYGIDRDPGTPPVATVRFTLAEGTGPYTVPAGTRLALPIGGDEDAAVFTTDEAATTADGAATIDVAVTGDTETSVLNGTPAETPISLLDPLTVVDRVTLVTPIAAGVDPEDDVTWFTRGSQRFARLAEALVLPRHFTASALERPEVVRAYTVDNTDPNAGSTGPHPGHVTVAVYGDGEVLAAATRDAIRADMDARAQANLAVHVIDPTVTAVDVTTTVVAVPGYTADQVTGLVTDALADYLSPLTWGWSGTVYRNDLIGLLGRVEGVQRVTDLAVPANDAPLAGVAPLATLGTVSVTVTGV